MSVGVTTRSSWYASKAIGVMLAVLVTLGGCRSVPGREGESNVERCLGQIATPTITTGVFIEPDDGPAPVLDEINGARCTIDLTVYLLTDQDVIDALDRAERRNVQVRVILDEQPFGGSGTQADVAQQLRAVGVDVKWAQSRFQFTHAKYLVIDQQVALIMNQNLTFSAVNGNREFGVISTEPGPVSEAQALFEQDWSGTSGPAAVAELVISPENSRRRILDLIGSSRVSIDMYAEVIRDDEVIAALDEARQRGVTVRLILNDPLEPDDQDSAVQLFNSGVAIRLASHLYIHAKTLIVDNGVALIGSQNYTATSLDNNREVGIEIDERQLVGRCIAVFERDWNRAEPGAPVSWSPVRDRTGMSSPAQT